MAMIGRLAGAFAFSILLPWSSWAQAEPPERLKIFLDCERCFVDYLREEIGFVDHVRDRADADVHVIVTSAETGAGGREYSADFIGLGPLSGVRRALRTTTASDDVDDNVRRQIATVIRIGLLNFVAHETVQPDLAVSVEAAVPDLQPPVTFDPWKRWVFSVRGEGSVEGEESQRQIEASGAISADRITPNWKITLGTEFEQSSERFDVEGGEVIEAERRQREFRGVAVKGLSDHWSAGLEGAMESTTFENARFALELAPAVEFNVFPYTQYTRRQLRLQYGAGVRRTTYYEATIYGKLAESHPAHAASLAFEQTERWGSLDTRVEWSQYLHDTSLSRLEAEGEVSWRVARGLSLSIEGNASRLRDQIGLPRRGATEEEVLLELRQLRSGHEFRVSFGMTYTFGSIFSAIVNPRFGQ
jgi:hypothetical protein